LSENVVFLLENYYNKMDFIRYEEGLMSGTNGKKITSNNSRKISDGKGSNNFLKYIKRFWRRILKPTMRKIILKIRNKVAYLLESVNKTDNNKMQTRKNSRSINKKKRQPTDWEKTFANDVTDKEFVSKIYKQFMMHQNKKPSKKNGQKT